jgi:excinuclease UvrABC nuclease subunit
LIADPLGKFRQAVPDLEIAITQLLAAPPVLLGEAKPPATPGVYAFVHEAQIRYIGEARNLADRLLRKHLSGDEGHILQHVFAPAYPDRLQRREFIKGNVHAQWVCLPDAATASVVERVLIWTLRPEWNRK